MTYRLEAEFVYRQTEPTDDPMNEFLDRVDEHLVEKLGARDLLIVSEALTSTFTVLLTADGDDSTEAFSNALGLLRTALHAEGCGTPDWPSPTEFLGASLRPTHTRGHNELASA